MRMIVAIMVMLTIHQINSLNNTTSDNYSILQKQRFVFIQNQDDLEQGDNIGAGFDLKDQDLFFSNSYVIKDDILYGGKSKYGVKEYYRRALNKEILSMLVNIKVSPEEIKKSDYQITHSPEFFVNKKILNDDIMSEFEYQYKYREKKQFTKVRITYNKDFLPTKIEWYYKGPEGLKWYTWRTYSYPFKNKAEFDKKLDEEIENIKEIQRENEGD